MTAVDVFKHSYLLKSTHADFATGRRKHLRFAIQNRLISFVKLNPHGPEPFEYLQFAKTDILDSCPRGPINALGNAKRAIHLTIENILVAWGLSKAFKDQNFPTQLAILQDLNAFPTRIIDWLNKKRNLVEHDYAVIDIQEVVYLIEIAELFLLIAYQYLRGAVVGAFVGIETDNVCYNWQLEPEQSKVNIYRVHHKKFVDTELGRIYYGFRENPDSELVSSIEITRDNQDQWIDYLDLFVYMTKQPATLLETEIQPNEHYHFSKVTGGIELEWDEVGLRDNP